MQAQLDKIREEYKTIKPEDIKVIDPCMGSGHILVYAFDVLMQIYETAGYSQRDAAKSILEHNLYGLDIDDRAFQLAYFAVMMKARQYNRFILNGETICHVYSIQESNGFNPDYLKLLGSDDLKATAEKLIDIFTDAKEYGSILNVDIPLQELEVLQQRIDEISKTHYDNFFDSARQSGIVTLLAPVLQQAIVMVQKYDVVVTNPPYMGQQWYGRLSAFVKKEYSDSKSDLFAVLIEKCGQMTKKNGYQAMITQQGWMFASSFNALRHSLLKITTIVNLLHLGVKTFDNDVGTIVQSSAFVLCNTIMDKYNSTFIRLTKFGSSAEKAAALLCGQNKFTIEQSCFFNLPANPLAYWVSDTVVHLFMSEKKVGDVLSLCAGLSTGNNDLFCRYWNEVNYDRIKMDCSDVMDTTVCEQTWFPCNSGGVFHRWTPVNLIVANWKNNGAAIRSYKNQNGKIASAARNTSYYFKEGLTWNKISTNFAFMYKSKGFIFDDTSRSAFVKQGANIMYVLALLNSKIALYLLKCIDQTFCFTNGDIEYIPYVYNTTYQNQIIDLCKQCISIEYKDLTFFEVSWISKHIRFYYGLVQRQCGKPQTKNYGKTM